jgi:hypothetical protein
MTESEPLTKEILRQISVIQNKIDGIGAALETLARVEERQAADRETVARLWSVLDAHGRTIATVTESMTEMQRARGSRSEAHVLWALVAAAMGACGFMLQMVLT